MKKTVSCVALILAACSPQADDNRSTSNAVENANEQKEAPAAGISVESNVRGIQIVPISTLPRHKGAVEGTDYCSEFVRTPGSHAAKAVRDAGWVVTGEGKAGGYDIVSFVGGLEPGTSGTCTLEQGNVALFKGDNIKAIAYGKQDSALAIGMIQTDQGKLKILDGDFLHEPAAMLTIGGDGAARIDPLAKVEGVCHGAAKVPNIQNLPIDKARKLLMGAGWKPVPRSEPVREEEDGRAFDLVSRGVAEADSCSGTGMAYCAFEYEGPAGHLSVTTVGDAEWPTVTRYGVTCR